MTAKLLIRIAAVLILIHLFGHGAGHFSWDKQTDPRMAEAVTAMKNNSTEFMGATKSLADYYSGYSFIMFGLFGMSIVVLWILSKHTTTNKKVVKQLLFPIGIVYLLFGVIEYFHFFVFAAMISLLAGTTMLWATRKLPGEPQDKAKQI